MFTRDPFDRALSGFFDKVLRKGWLEGPNMTLNHYFDILVEGDTRNVHFTKQLSICDPCFLNISYLGRTETMNQDMDYIINDLTNMHEKVPFKVEDVKTNESLVRNKSSYDVKTLRTLDLQKILAFIFAYRFDYLAFGYNPYHALLRYTEINSL